MKHLCVIPFAGFYESVHDQAVDDALDQMFSDRDTGCKINSDLVMRAWSSMDWRQVHTDYAKEYCENFAEAFKLDLTFDELNSPREYNFVSDRVFGWLSTESLRKMWGEVDTPALRIKIHENHTSRSGFSSFYSNVLEDWGDVMTWDHNQIATLLEVYVDLETNGEFDQYREADLMEHSYGNGVYDEILWRNCPIMPRLTKVHEYLEARAKREEVEAIRAKEPDDTPSI